MSLENERVLVTGAGGFIGSHLVERLVQEGAKVRALVHYNALGSRGWLDQSGIVNEVEVIAGDITDHASVRSVVKGTTIVYHLAALIAIPYSYRAPVSYVNTNITGTLNVLQAVMDEGIERLIHTSTSEVYGSARYTPIDEAHPLHGQSPYSASKIAADKLAEAFYCSFDLPVVTLRPFNTFGPRQSARAVIPTIITQCLKGPEIKLGQLSPTRDLNFIGNTIDGFILAAKSPGCEGKTLNLGSGQEVSIADLAGEIAGIMHTEIDIKCEEERKRPPESEVNRLLADSQQAKRVLGWEPKIHRSEGLEITIDWVRMNRKFYDAGIYTL